MRDVKGTLLWAFLCIEAGMFIFFYSFGAHGLRALQCLNQENEKLRNGNICLKQEIQELERECALWATSSFYKEKVARERLQMARNDETIYYIAKE